MQFKVFNSYVHTINVTNRIKEIKNKKDNIFAGEITLILFLNKC